MSKPRYLTKSRFKLALECPAKLFFIGKKEYANSKLEDSFLEALAEGGIQAGELAKQYHPGGIDVKSLDYEEALLETKKLLERDEVVIFEAAVKFENLFIRVDILRKKGDRIYLYEVKSKSYNPGEDSFTGARGRILSEWRPYLEDIAFQKHVVKRAFPESSVQSHLTLVDKSTLCPTDGLNQKFRVHTDERGRKHVIVTPLTNEEIENPILIDINVDLICDDIYQSAIDDNGIAYTAMVRRFAEAYADDVKLSPKVSSVCKECQFFASEGDLRAGLKCGKSECWSESLGWTLEEVRQPTVLDIYNFRSKDKMIANGVIRMRDMCFEDINPKPSSKPGISNSERQWMQIEKLQNNDDSPWVDRADLASELSSWQYPLHFIDFETAMVAIPFNRGRHPYEPIAFQYSHHVLRSDGTLAHAGEFLNAVPGQFPNYDFLRALKSELEADNGTIFRYAAHENTYLNHIHRQLIEEKGNVPDREELIRFIESVTKSSADTMDGWRGDRNMVDLCEVVKRFYYDPLTGGSASIKKVLPAVMARSEKIQTRYSEPVYGTKEIPSKNFKEMTWVQFADDKVVDPYKLLPRIFEDVDEKELLMLSRLDEELHEGGAAMAAYARLQFEEMGDVERSAIRRALLKYCELDTLAMVMVYEGLKEMCETLT